MFNKIILIGRIVATPELHKTNNDKSVARATIAVNRRYKDQNGEREADFINIVVWGKLAESRAQRAMRENNAGQDLADLVLEEEELPF